MTPRDRSVFPYTLLPRDAAVAEASAGQREAYLRRFTVLGDPVADELVGMFARQPAGEGRALFELALEQGIDAVHDAPPELVAFFQDTEEPCWADADQLDLAARVIGRTGQVGLCSLAMGALLGGYLAYRPIKPLVITGDLDRMTARRIAETTHWFVLVTAPGGLHRFAPGWKATVRVRLMHALVRAGMSRRSTWDWDAWDHPVNQSQMAGTNALFATAVLSGGQALGLRFTNEETAAVYHFWRVVGRLLGVNAEILPGDARDTARMLHLQEYEFGGPDADSKRLARALVRAIGPLTVGASQDMWHRLAARAARGVLCAYARRLLGTEYADYLELPDNRLLQCSVGGVAAAIRCGEAVRRIVPGATGMAESYGRRQWERTAQRMMAQHRGSAAYRRHDQLAHQLAAFPSPRRSAAPPLIGPESTTGQRFSMSMPSNRS